MPTLLERARTRIAAFVDTVEEFNGSVLFNDAFDTFGGNSAEVADAKLAFLDDLLADDGLETINTWVTEASLGGEIVAVSPSQYAD